MLLVVLLKLNVFRESTLVALLGRESAQRWRLLLLVLLLLGEVVIGCDCGGGDGGGG